MFTFNTHTKGTSPISATELAKIAVPERKGIVSDRWMGVKHSELINQLVKTCEASKVKIKETKLAVSSDKHDLFADFQVDVPAEMKRYVPPGLGISMGLVHSNMGRYSMRLLVGAKVFVCSNGLVTMSGELVLQRKHTTGLVINELLAEGVEKWKNRLKEVPAFVQQLQARKIKEPEAEHIILESARVGAIPWSEVGKVDAEWRKPSHKEFKDRTAWSLYNSFTELLKERPVHGQLKAFRWLAPALLGKKDSAVAA